VKKGNFTEAPLARGVKHVCESKAEGKRAFSPHFCMRTPALPNTPGRAFSFVFFGPAARSFVLVSKYNKLINNNIKEL